MAVQKKSPFSPEEWQLEIENGLEYRRMFGKEDCWDTLEAAYLNDPNGITAIGPNLIYSMGDALLSALIVPDPEVLVTPRSPVAVDSAPIIESQANTFIKTLDLKDHVEQALLHSYLYGRGILKIGYDSEFGWDHRYDIGGPIEPAGLTLTQFNKKGNRIESGIAKPGQPWVRAIDPHDIVVPWGTVDLETATWIAHRVIRTNEAIKQDPKYSKTGRLEPQISMEQFMSSYHRTSGNNRLPFRNTTTFSQNSKQVYNELWEIHDRMTGRIYVISPDYNQFLRDDIDAIQTIGAPFVSIGFIKHPRTFWVTPQAYYLLQIQATQFDIAQQAEKQRRINVVRFITDETSMSDDEINKLLSGDVGAVARAKTQRPLKDVFVPFPKGDNLDLMAHAAFVRQDARDAIGMSRNQLGEFDTSSRRTATESGIVQQGAQNRQSRRTDAMIKLYLLTLKKVIALITRFWTMPHTVRVNDKWVFFTGDMLRGEVNFDMSLSTKRHLSMTDRKGEALALLANLAQYPGANLPAIEQYVTRVSSDPTFASFFLSTAQQKGLGEAPSGPNAGTTQGLNQAIPLNQAAGST